MSTLSLEELTRFGITPADEDPHPYSPDYEWWNESVFYDWYDADGSNAGHCRIGWHPNQQRLWMWLFLWNGAEWVAIEETRLPFSALKLPQIAYDDGWGLAFSYSVGEALRRGRFAARGFGRVLCGPRAGMILAVDVGLDVETVGAAHSLGQQTLAGHSAEGYSVSRFEQPIAVRGAYTIAGETHAITARGERDHSWGPRWWNIEWNFLVTNSEAFRLQATRVRVGGDSEIATGYVHRDGVTQAASAVEFALAFDDANVTQPVSGRFAVTGEGGARLAGRIESITATEIDITHTFVPPRRSVYRRALVRVLPDDAPAAVGWLESNRFVDA
ncbi:MAG: hypothetical protein ABI629_09535 [bacterium]